MRRRALLASLAAGVTGLAGCSFGDGGSDATHTPVDPSATDTPVHSQPQTDTEADRRTGEPPRPEEPPHVVDLETGPRTYALSPYIETEDRARVALWFDRTATAEHPARLRGWLRNGNDFENTFRIQWLPVVGRVHARQPRGYDHEASLHLAPTENNELAATVPQVVRDETGYWRVEDVGPWMTETYRMAPGEWVRLEYEVVGSPEMSGRPTGTYEFDDEATLTVWDTASPGPAAESRFAGRSLPDFSGDGGVQWYHEADADTVAFVRPSTERVELDGLVEFEVVNHSHERLKCGHWNLYKLVDGEWFHVGPWLHTSDCRHLPPGGRKQWLLRAFNGEAVPTGQDCHGGLTRGYLGGGEYAVVAGYGHPEPESGALVELVGEPATVVPTADVTTERDGSTVTVTSERYGDDEHPPDATFTLQYAETGGERVVAEQVMRPSQFGGDGRGLRNALPFLSADVSRVIVRTDDHVVDSVLGHDEQTRRFTFRGRGYVASRGASDE
ncbi:hypothetical protein [Haloarcula sp. JP-L23]|uniref:hypothetical protein n=1 Tax=Haloarcula sp. JP-L23 TaxID=2716717 RepID=UPI00140F22F4|nr:hypothetical protein G9465_00595 [Haloarcula sp. JP-L23]